MRLAAYEVPYRKHHDQWFPTIPIKLTHLGREFVTDGLLDSGATVTTIKEEIAGALGIPARRMPKESILTAGGVLEGYKYKIGVQVLEEKPFECEVLFASMPKTSFNVLGRKDFFERFEVTFQEKAKQVKLTSLE